MTCTPIDLTAEQLELLRHIVSDVARFHRLSWEEANDFARCVQLGLLERPGEIFGCYTGRSSLRTYLAVVVTRMLLDWRKARGA